MYKRPSSRSETIRLVVVYSLMTVAVLALVGVLILSILNYRFDSNTGTLEQRGLIQFDSIPSGAAITVDGTTITPRTPAKHSVDPGEHSFTMQRDGYRTWQKKAIVAAGSLVWLNYARLVPNDVPVESVHTYQTLHSSLASPSKETILAHLKANSPEFVKINIAKDAPESAVLTLPLAAYQLAGDAAASAESAVFTIDQWDEGSRYVLIRYQHGDTSEWIVLDTERPEQSRNVTRELTIPIASAQFSGRSGNVLYVLSGNELRKLDLSGGTISRPLVANVASFDLYDANTVSYVTLADDKGMHAVGVYREGDTQPHVITSAKADVPLSIALGSYFSTSYVAVGEGKTLTVYRGQYDKAPVSLTKLTSQTFNDSVTSVEFNPSKSYAIAWTNSEYGSYGIEHGSFSRLAVPAEAKKNSVWLDDMYMAHFTDGKLRMQELDGANQNDIGAATAGQATTLSRNGTYLYSFGTTKDSGEVQLQRVRLILK